METIEQWMLEFFRGRLADARRFLAVGCHWDPHFTSDDAANELIVNISHTSEGPVVITRPVSSFRALRYHLRQEGETWLIWHIESECPGCHGTPGDDECRFCEGLGWCSGDGVPKLAPGATPWMKVQRSKLG